MSNQYPEGLRLASIRQADVHFYLAKAKALRAEAYTRWYRSLKGILARAFCRPLFGCGEAAASR